MTKFKIGEIVYFLNNSRNIEKMRVTGFYMREESHGSKIVVTYKLGIGGDCNWAETSLYRTKEEVAELWLKSQSLKLGLQDD